ncbi:MAG: resolvase [Phormidesmis sp.]
MDYSTTATESLEKSASNSHPENRILVDSADQLIPIESVQKILNRSRASVYRYANTHQTILNPPFDPNCLNPEIRNDKDAPLMFHPNEVARFAQDILGIKQVTIELAQPVETETNRLLQAVLSELQAIKQLLTSKE